MHFSLQVFVSQEPPLPKRPERLQETHEVETEEQQDQKKEKCREVKGTRGSPCPPLPVLLPWTDRVTLVSAIVDVTGAQRSDARILARVVEILREKGGQAPVAALTRNPKRLQTILSRHARLLEV